MDKEDKRVEFLESITLKLLKLKRDKWQKFIAAEQNRNIIQDFFEKLDFCSLFISLNAGSQLFATLDFPRTFKNVIVYFVKKENVVINIDSIQNVFVGTFASSSVNAAADVAEVVHSMRVKKKDDTKKIDVGPDVSLQAHMLKNELFVIRDRLKGRTFLPVPENADSLEKTAYRRSHCIDSKLMHAFETLIIDWTYRVAKVLSKVSAQPILDGLNPLPKAEFDFWSDRLMNLEYINEQLMNPKVLKMAEILETAESLREAEDIVIYLKPLQKRLDEIEQLEYSLLPSYTRSMMHTVALIWANSEYYCHPEKIIVILQEICNLYIDMTRNFLGPDEVMKGLEGEIDETIGKIKLSIVALVTLRASYDQCNLDMDKYFKNGTPKSWDFPSHLVFTRLNVFLQRLQTIEEVYKTSVEFLKLEKVALQGIRGGALGASVLHIYEEFLELIKIFAECTYDPIDTSEKVGMQVCNQSY
ncbi:hypothetical protein PDJAM_G00037750 [Pangasius djambal]|uniref:Uncharacterized protein n=1 Tax=Pangasius djambal TaxID=1691987 RepID=A0ACC5YS73_9TELE|nr:hypothetical protein [Pangasius djambal]